MTNMLQKIEDKTEEMITIKTIEEKVNEIMRRKCIIQIYNGKITIEIDEIGITTDQILKLNEFFGQKCIIDVMNKTKLEWVI